MNAALVKLVEHNGAEVGEERILLQAGGKDPFGREQHAGVRREPSLEPDVPADQVAERPALLVRDPPGNRTSRQTSRLQHDRRPVNCERGRDPSGLAGARRSRQHESPLPPHQIDDLRKMIVDGKRRRHYSCRSAAAGSIRRARLIGT